MVVHIKWMPAHIYSQKRQLPPQKEAELTICLSDVMQKFAYSGGASGRHERSETNAVLWSTSGLQSQAATSLAVSWCIPVKEQALAVMENT